jgi:hypothetical protein
MTTEKHDPWALLREAREALVRAENRMMAPPHQVPDVIERIDAALAEHEAEGDKLVFTRVGPCLKDQHGDEWWNAGFLRLAQSDKDSLRRVTDIIQYGAKAEDERDKAQRENERLAGKLKAIKTLLDAPMEEE